MALSIRKQQKKITVYTVGGRDFVSHDEAKHHLTELNKTLGFAYYLVRSRFDQTEGRGYFDNKVVGIRLGDSFASNAIISFCLDNFGDPTGSWHGHPVDVWTLDEPKMFDDVERLREWIKAVRSSAKRYSVAFEGPILCDQFGKRLPADHSPDLPHL